MGWNFHFLYSLNDRETEELLTLLSPLNSFQPSQQPYCRIWTLDSSSSYTYKSFFDHITKILIATIVHLPRQSNWQVKAPSKVKVFMWMAILICLNANKLLQIHRSNRVLSPDICVMCYYNGKTCFMEDLENLIDIMINM